MCAWYLFSPLQAEINVLLHKIAHQFTAEDHHVEKPTHEKHHHEAQHKHDFLATNTAENAEKHHQKKDFQEHTHELITFFNTFFKNDSSKEHKEKHLFENKIDKHIISFYVEIPQPVLEDTAKKYWCNGSIAENFGLETPIPPPRSHPA